MGDSMRQRARSRYLAEEVIPARIAMSALGNVFGNDTLLEVCLGPGARPLEKSFQ